MYCHTCGGLCCYADDSSFFFSSKNIESLEQTISEKYQSVSTFMGNNKLKLNGDKTHLMLLSTDRAWRSKLTEESLTLVTSPDGPVIHTSKCENLLGCIISQNLKWTDHILLSKNSLVKQLGTRLNALKVMSKVSDFKTRKMLANGLFMSKLVYLMPLWGGCEQFLIRSLQTMQNKAVRVVSSRSIYTPTKTLLKECGWLSVVQLIFFHSVLLLFKVRRAKSPSYLYEMCSSDVRYDTRLDRTGKLSVNADYVPESGLNLKSFRWRSVTYWNRLPVELRQIENVATFKSKLKNWIQENIEV